MIMSSVDLLKGENETDLSYIYRLGTARDNGLLDMSWSDLARILNKNLRAPDDYLTEKTYRNNYSVMKRTYDEVFSKLNISDELAELRNEKNELIKERIKIGDERRELKALLREKAREENFEDQIMRILTERKPDPLSVDPYISKDLDDQYSLLIPVYDIHAGLIIDSWWNKYNNDIMRERFQKYVHKIKDVQKIYSANSAYVVLSELLNGVIRTRLRIESNENVIKQFVNVCSQINWFLFQMSTIFNEVHVYVAPGNHSRILQKKEDNLNGENFDHLALFYLRGYLQNVENIEFHENSIEESIAMFTMPSGHKVFCCHGDKDTPENICRHITEMTKIIPDICLLGHLHHNSLLTVNGGAKVIQTGSFCGPDAYCSTMRLQGQPEQALAVVGLNGLECLYDVCLK